MISDGPIQAAGDLSTPADKVRAFVAVARLKAHDGLTLAELSELIVASIPMAMSAVETRSMPGADKKKNVLDLVASLFDEFADLVIPFYFAPVWWIVRPSFRALTLAVAGGAVNALLPLVKGAT